MPAAPTTNGPIHSVRCPHCGKGNDFRDMQSQQLLDTGAVVECDFCKRFQVVVGVKPITVITVRQASQQEIAGATRANPGQNLPPPRRPTTLSPAATRKLLRGR